MTGPVKSEPRVGIFWLLRDRLIVDTSLLSEAEAGGDWLNHARGHYDYWTRQQRQGLVPHDVEFEEPPRGRCVFNRRRSGSPSTQIGASSKGNLWSLKS